MNTIATGIEMARFLDKVSVADNECWRWTGGKDLYGYGAIGFDGVTSRAHRVAYRIWIGEIPADLELDHLCKARDCVNPLHLEPVTHAENVRRAKRDLLTCPRGHAYTPDNVLLNKRGYKICRTCHVLRMRKKQGYKGTIRKRIKARGWPGGGLTSA